MGYGRAATLALAAIASMTIASMSWGRFEIVWEYAGARWHGPFRVDDRLAQFGARANARLAPRFAAAEVTFPPQEIALLAFKDARILQVYARSGGQGWRFVHSYAVQGASGFLGPKLREGDEQVPEGIYRVTLLNPNSRFHVSLRLDYPNAFDRRMAREDHRSNLGGDIMIHGKSVSAGCLAMGDEAAEDLFLLAAQVLPAQMRVLISPTDFRESAWLMPVSGSPVWTGDLYRQIEAELRQFPRHSLETLPLTAEAQRR
jgi:L,D-transpeptidase catalytic domain